MIFSCFSAVCEDHQNWCIGVKLRSCYHQVKFKRSYVKSPKKEQTSKFVKSLKTHQFVFLNEHHKKHIVHDSVHVCDKCPKFNPDQLGTYHKTTTCS